MDEERALSIIGDVFNGYTPSEFKGRLAYIKHFCIQDQKINEIWQKKYLETAKKRGLPLETEVLSDLKTEGLWTPEDDLQLHSLEEQAKNLNQTIKNLRLKKDINVIKEELAKVSKEFSKKQALRKELVGTTAEDFASAQANLKFLQSCFFSDKELKEKLFDDEEFDDLGHQELDFLTTEYRKTCASFSDLDLQRAVLSDLFSSFLSQTENFSGFYGKAVIELSVFQLKLASYGRMFYNIFQYNDDIPEVFRKDPEAILRHVELKQIKQAGRNHKSFAKRAADESSATAVFGATKDELKSIDPDAKEVSLLSVVEKAGGSMSMNDIIKMMEQ